ncbi:MAG TPA: XRE family transcriptional regulator [Thermoanaerobaculia bacterium]|jgi:DNA-binding transcriptional regulator YiaG|nr:XRE family transcriptional regulator [Thermoanaerobaculia bacterium]
MNPIELLQEKLTAQFPRLKATLDRPGRPQGDWFLDAELGGKNLVAVWNPERGFALSSRAEVEYGEAPDEQYPDADSAFLRASELLATEAQTVPPEQAVLKTLRESRKLSQEELAKRLHVTQATVSKMERRPDMYLSTLRSAIAAMGGELEVRVRFPDEEFRVMQFEPSGKKRPVRKGQTQRQA